MSAQHTPGPWCLSEKSIDVWDEKSGATICEVPRKNSHPVQAANARLIAAAPDMLEALEAEEIAHNAWAEWAMSTHPVVSAEHERLVMRKDEAKHNASILRRAAIIKAKGEKQ